MSENGPIRERRWGINMLRTMALAAGMAVLLVGCGGGNDSSAGGGGTGGVGTGGGTGGTTSAPQGLQYAVATGEAGMVYGPYQPTVTGTVTGYAVSPALPEGLTFDVTTGTIAGTPVAGSSGTYTVTASNAAGSATAALTIVVLVPPTLSYPGPVTGTAGQALAQVVPTLAGNADYMYVYPSLPDGLTLDSVTGIVSGTPSSERIGFTYVITVGNAGGAQTTADLVLAIDPPPAGTAVNGVFRDDTVIGLGYVSGAHSGLTDTSGAFTYEEGQGIAFSVGAVRIGGLPTAKALMTPMDLVPQGTVLTNHVLNVERFLMMLDQDGNPNNGIQISADVTAAAANWTTVDFDTVDLPTLLGPIVQQASSLDGISHVLPDAATAQAQLLAGFYCVHAGNYFGTYQETPVTSSGRGLLTESVYPFGGMEMTGHSFDSLSGFAISTGDAESTLLEGTFLQSNADTGATVQGSIASAPVLQGTYQASTAGSFQAVANDSVSATYKFIGSYLVTFASGAQASGATFLGMDGAGNVSDFAVRLPWSNFIVRGISGTVSGNTFTGSASYSYPTYGRPHFSTAAVSGTYSNTASGVALDAQFSTSQQDVVTIRTIGCRAN